MEQHAMVITQNETLANLLAGLQLSEIELKHAVQTLAAVDHRYLKDLRINVSNSLNYENLSKKEGLLLALSIAANEKNAPLIQAFQALAAKAGATEAEIAEIFACVSLMNVNNVFYRFRHFTNKDYYNQAPAGIKMSIMMNPVLGKEFFELVSLAVSAVNGCEMCVNAHEESVLKHGATQAKVYDAVRLSAIVKGLSALIY